MTEKRLFELFVGNHYGIKSMDGEVIIDSIISIGDADVLVDWLNALYDENEQLKASLYAEKTNTAEVINEYAKQFKRHSSQFSFMIDLAEDLGIDVSKLEALDD